MSFYISIIGIDGSGKSTVLPALANLVPAELGLTAVAVGDACWGKTPEEDLFRPGFTPGGELLSTRLGRLFRRGAKAATGQRRLYPLLKLGQLALQERTVRKLAIKYSPEVTFSDGNLLLSSGGRAINYFKVSTRLPAKAAPLSAYRGIEALYNYVVGGTQLPRHIVCAIPGLGLMRWLHRGDQLFKLNLLKLPDAVIFLDIEPATALARLQAAGKELDAHENIRDLSQAQAMYRGVVQFFQHRQGARRTLVIDPTDMATGEILEQIIDFVQALLSPKKKIADPGSTLGTPAEPSLKTASILKKALSYQYLAYHTLPHLRQGSLHELTFPFSRSGQLLLKEGYSANLMQVIYLQKQHFSHPLEKLFMSYPLHQAIYHRWQILNGLVEAELRQCLAVLPAGEPLKILTAPSGYSLDLLQPLQRLAQSGLDISPVQLVALDLDPQGEIEAELSRSAGRAGVGLQFIRGDLTQPALKQRLQDSGPYDLILFIGFSCWIAKPHLVDQLRLIRQELLASGGTLFTECFSAQTFALAGKHLGYRANYYDPAEFTQILAYCGFDPARLTWKSEPNGINHICIAHRESRKEVAPDFMGKPVSVSIPRHQTVVPV